MSIAKVQEVFSYSSAGGSVNKTITIAAPSAGNTLVLMTQDTNGTASVTAVTGGGVTWSSVATLASLAKGQIWIGPNSSGSGTTITVTVSNTYARFDLSLSEWSGMSATATADGGSQALSNNPNVTTPSVTPTAGKPVLLLAIYLPSPRNTTAGPTGGFSALSTAGGSGYAFFAYQIVTSASGSYQAGWTVSAGYGTTLLGLYAFDGSSSSILLNPGIRTGGNLSSKGIRTGGRL